MSVTLGLDESLVGELPVRYLAALDEDGATISDAVELWLALENPEEMIRDE